MSDSQEPLPLQAAADELLERLQAVLRENRKRWPYWTAAPETFQHPDPIFEWYRFSAEFLTIEVPWFDHARQIGEGTYHSSEDGENPDDKGPSVREDESYSRNTIPVIAVRGTGRGAAQTPMETTYRDWAGPVSDFHTLSPAHQMTLLAIHIGQSDCVCLDDVNLEREHIIGWPYQFVSAVMNGLVYEVTMRLPKLLEAYENPPKGRGATGDSTESLLKASLVAAGLWVSHGGGQKLQLSQPTLDGLVAEAAQAVQAISTWHPDSRDRLLALEILVASRDDGERLRAGALRDRWGPVDGFLRRLHFSFLTGKEQDVAGLAASTPKAAGKEILSLRLAGNIAPRTIGNRSSRT